MAPYTASITGFVNGDTPSVVTGAPSLSTIPATPTAAGTYPITAAQGSLAASNYSFTFVPGTLTITKINPTVTWANPAGIVYGTALSGTQLNATASVPGTFTYTPASGSIPAAGTDTLSVTFKPTDTTDYNTVTQTVQIVVSQAAPPITWSTPSPITYGTALSALQLNATSTVVGSFAYTPAAGAVLAAGTQTLSVTFTPTDTVDYTPVTKTVQLIVNQAAPVVTWTPPTAITYGTALSGTQLNATASVPGSFVYTPAAGVILSAGTQTLSVTFTPTDTTDYTTVTKTVQLTVNKATPVITWPAPAAITYGTALSATQLNATATVGGSFVYTPAAGAILNAGTQTLSVTFTPTDSTDYTTATQTVSLTVTKATLTVNAASTSRPYNTANPTFAGTITGAVNGDVFTESFSTTAVLNSPVGTYPITPTVAGPSLSNYTVVTNPGTLTVTQATPVITWNNPTAITYGTALSATQLNATATVGGGFVYTPAAGAVLNAGTQTLSVIFTPTDATNYKSVTQTAQIVVNKATLTVTAANASRIYNTADPTFTGTITGAVNGDTFTESFSTTAILSSPVGTYPITPTAAGTNLANYTVGTNNGTLTVTQATPIVTWNNPAAITYGTVLSATQLNATATVGGSFTYSPSAGVILNAGTQTLSVTFTPTDTTNYKSVTQTVQIVVNKAILTVTAADASRIYNTANPTFTGTVTGAVNGDTFTESFTTSAILSSPVGSYPITPTAVGANLANYTVVVNPGTLTVTQATPVVTWNNPAAITYGTALSTTQLNATAAVGGSFVYSPASGVVLNAGTQTLSVTFTPTDNTDYKSVTQTAQIVVNKATLTVTAANASRIYNTANPTFTGTITGAVNGDTFTESFTTTAILSSPVGTYPITPTAAGANLGNYTVVVNPGTLTVTQATPVVIWNNPAAIPYGTVLSATQLNATATVGGSFVYSPAAGAILNAGTQTLSVTFTPTDATDYKSVTQTVQIVVNKATLTVTATDASRIYNTANPTFTGTVTGAVNGDTFTESFSTTAVLGSPVGAYPITPTAAGTNLANYTIITTNGILTITQATPVVTWNNPASITYGTALSATQLNATATVGGSFAYTPAAGAILNAGTQTLSVTFTPTDTTNYKSVTQTVQIVVNKATLTVAAADASRIYNTANPTFTGTVTGSVNGDTFTESFTTTAILGSPVGTYPITPTAAGANLANYTVVTTNGTLTVTQATPVVTWNTPAAIGYGTVLSATQLNATASVGGSFVYSPAAGVVLNAGTQTLSVTFNPTDTTNYKSVTQTVQIVVNKATLAVTAANATRIYNTVNPTFTGTVTGAVNGDTFTESFSTTAILSSPAGTYPITPTAVGTNLSNYTVVTTNGVLTITQATPVVTWNNPASITYGTALSATQLNATATVGGSFAYTPAAGAILNAGTQTLSVTFTPTDSTDYTTVTQTVSLTVTKAAPVITWNNPASIVYGTALSATQLNASATVGGGFVYTPAAGTILNAGAQTLSVTFTPTDTTDYTTATKTVSLTVTQATLTVNAASASRPYNTANPAFTGTITGAVNGDVFTESFSTTAVLSSSAGTYPITPTAAGPNLANYTVVVNPGTLTVTQATPVVTWNNPAAITYGTALSATQLNASATVGGTFTYTPAAGSIPAAGTDTLSVTFTPTDTTDYTTVTKTVSIVVNKQSLVVTAGSQTVVFGGTAAPYTATITGFVNGDTQASSVTGAPSLTTTPASPTTVGIYPIIAAAGSLASANYTFTFVDGSLSITKATPTVTWNNPANITFGTTLSSTQLNATASVPGSFVYTPAAGTTPATGTDTLSVTFTPTDTTDYASVTKTVQITVNQATPVITWNNPASITFGTTLSATQLNATASVPGTFVYTPAAGTTPATGTDTLSVTFTPTDTTDYTTATKTVQITVTQAAPVITWNNPAAITYGTTLSATQLNATATVPGTFVYTPAAGSVPAAGTDTLSVTFTPTDTTDYTTITKTVQIVVNQATPVITWNNPASITYGTALSTTQLNATASVPGTLVYTPAAGSIPAAGTDTLSVTFTPTDTANYTTATKTVQITVTQATPVITWANPASITYGTALSATQLNATASVPGTLVYTPVAGSVPAAGTDTLSVTFTPTDTANYTTATKTVQITVTQATPVITWANPASITYGTALSTVQLNATASVPAPLSILPPPAAFLRLGRIHCRSPSLQPIRLTTRRRPRRFRLLSLRRRR